MRLAWCVSVAVAAWVGARVSAMPAPPPTPSQDVPTFSRDVAPILYKNCAQCHRAGEIAPMPLITYKDARPWARSIKEKVLVREMPPWHADAHAGTFANECHSRSGLRLIAVDEPAGSAANRCHTFPIPIRCSISSGCEVCYDWIRFSRR